MHGRLLRPRKWRVNEDDEVVPTVRAKRIHVKEWVGGYREDESDEVDPDCHQDEQQEQDGAVKRVRAACS